MNKASVSGILAELIHISLQVCAAGKVNGVEKYH